MISGVELCGAGEDLSKGWRGSTERARRYVARSNFADTLDGGGSDMVWGRPNLNGQADCQMPDGILVHGA
eukprot:3860500-Rhodomonas_salina.1